MTVRLPLRISTTCEALLVSFASLPATKKPQNACARRGAAVATAPAIARTPNQRNGERGIDHFSLWRRWGGLLGIPSSGTAERTSAVRTTFPRGALARPFAAVGIGRPFGLSGGPPHWSYAGVLQATGLSQ